MKTLADVLGRAEKDAEPGLRQVADQALRVGMVDWSQKAAAEIQGVCEAAVTKATRDWRAKEANLNRQIVRAVAATHTQALMDQWATAAAAQVEAELDERGLISTDVLEGIAFTRPPRKGEKKPVATDAVDCTDEEFMAWYVGQLGERGIDNTNRLALRLLLVAALDWIRDASGHWREPRLAEV